MMDAVVVGSGLVGSEIARDLARSKTFRKIHVVDANRRNLNLLRGISKIRLVQADIFAGDKLDKILATTDLVCGALPGRLGYRMIKQVVEAGKDLVDISYTPEDPFRLNRLAERNNSIFVPQCGVAPGLSNMCVGDASRRLDKLRSVRIMVGGLPRYPRPPLNYQFVFSPDDVINEYTRYATLIRNGRPTQVPPLSEVGMTRFPGVGELEYFVTDGLGTLPHSFTDVDEMAEYTLRYPGHASMMESLRSLGLLEQTPIKIDGRSLEPRRLVLELMRPLTRATRKEDLLAFKVDVDGKLGHVSYQMLDFYNARSKVSAMARTTAYTCTAVAHLVARDQIKKRGVVPPEHIGRVEELFRIVRSFLSERGVRLMSRPRC